MEENLAMKHALLYVLVVKAVNYNPEDLGSILDLNDGK